MTVSRVCQPSADLISSVIERSFLIGTLLVSGLIIAVFHLSHQVADFVLAPWKVYLTVAVFAVISLVTHRGMVKALSERPTLFANRFMASIVLKLLIGFVLFLVIGLTSPDEEKIPFGLAFLACYLLFTIFGSKQAMALKNGARRKE